MSFAATVGHTFTGVLGHDGRVHLPQHRTAEPAPPREPEHRRRTRSASAIDAAVREHHDELEQWRAAFTFAAGFHR